ncbi:hypothetical protein CHO01_21970 [Cellulomonas hominis]|uniref:DUF7694 domain-containing protein n=1 Tax=Cellulomonas hominis TaxID=156981 RepID=A0A511FCW8_9CELL|nr:hypothetical protein [Cellulomonas hominis]MBB5474678.1 hypothetical protein [Cellulomonas hominis]NKY05842.1 hypothetical protein [Cellulomonas hominis]GEL47081.1 hypothetical protein CHO01_21970 [Cellulomonas hominis]
MTGLDPLAVRRRLGRDDWSPPEPFGPDGFRYRAKDGNGTVIVSCSPLPLEAGPTDRDDWLHASISRRDAIPSYEDLVLLHGAVWGEGGHAVQVFVPTAEHLNIHPRTLHLWGRADGQRLLPNFGVLGSI